MKEFNLKQNGYEKLIGYLAAYNALDADGNIIENDTPEAQCTTVEIKEGKTLYILHSITPDFDAYELPSNSEVMVGLSTIKNSNDHPSIVHLREGKHSFVAGRKGYLLTCEVETEYNDGASISIIKDDWVAIFTKNPTRGTDALQISHCIPDETFFTNTPNNLLFDFGNGKVIFNHKGLYELDEAKIIESGLGDYIENATSFYGQILKDFEDELGFLIPMENLRALVMANVMSGNITREKTLEDVDDVLGHIPLELTKTSWSNSIGPLTMFEEHEKTYAIMQPASSNIRLVSIDEYGDETIGAIFSYGEFTNALLSCLIQVPENSPFAILMELMNPEKEGATA